ncbi:MAG: hypothetical protein QOF98_501 [Streptomyces sp.]|nr:hypothetical protein [Streptomyces sp.]
MVLRYDDGGGSAVGRPAPVAALNLPRRFMASAHPAAFEGSIPPGAARAEEARVAKPS